MGKSDVVDMLFELLGDPIRLEAIRDDPIIKDVLNKILVMQKLTAKDTNKRQKLEKLQRYHSSAADQDDSDDSSLRELIRICDALTRPPNQVLHSLIRGVLIQSCSAGAKNFTNYVFCCPQFSGVIQNIENRCAILTLFVYVD